MRFTKEQVQQMKDELLDIKTELQKHGAEIILEDQECQLLRFWNWLDTICDEIQIYPWSTIEGSSVLKCAAECMYSNGSDVPKDREEYIIKTRFGVFVAKFNDELGVWNPAFGGQGRIPNKISPAHVDAWVNVDRIFSDEGHESTSDHIQRRNGSRPPGRQEDANKKSD